MRRLVLPNEPAATVEQMRALEAPRRLLLLAELDGELAGSGLAERSDTGGGFVAPRVLPELAVAAWAARCSSGCSSICAPAASTRRPRTRPSAAAIAFAHRHGFVEIGPRGGAGAGRSARRSRSRRRTTASSSRRSRSDPTLLERAYARGVAGLRRPRARLRRRSRPAGRVAPRRGDAARRLDSPLSTATASSATPGCSPGTTTTRGPSTASPRSTASGGAAGSRPR